MDETDRDTSAGDPASAGEPATASACEPATASACEPATASAGEPATASAGEPATASAGAPAAPRGSAANAPASAHKLAPPLGERGFMPVRGECETKSSAPVAIWSPVPVRGRGDGEVARVAGRQCGVVSWPQLQAAGLGHHAVAHRVGAGRLFRVHRGVYFVGRPSPEPRAAEWAAILYLGGHAVLSHRSAAALWGLVEDAPADVTLTAVARQVRSRPGLRVHRVAALDPADTRVRHYLPVTAPARTIIDLAADTSFADLETALAEGRAQRLVSDDALRRALERVPGRAGVAAVRALLEGEHEPARTDSWLQRRLLALIRAAQLPEPLVNQYVVGLQVDFYWPTERLVIETDGHQFHGHRKAFERDRKRDQILVAAGFRVIRVTRRQLLHEPMAVIARIAMALQLAAA